jgi:hypothetical protein
MAAFIREGRYVGNFKFTLTIRKSTVYIKKFSKGGNNETTRYETQYQE